MRRVMMKCMLGCGAAPWMISGRMSAMYNRSDAAALLRESSQTSPHTAATSEASSDFAMNAVGIA